MKLIWASQARKDRREIFNYIKSSNPVAALELDKKFLEAANLLTINPGLGRQGNALAKTRALVVHRHYILIYAVGGGTVRVLRIMHTSRQWPPPHA